MKKLIALFVLTMAWPLPLRADLSQATSTAQEGTVTSSAATATSGTASFAAGAGTIGPLRPNLGRDVRVILKGTWTGTFVVGTSSDSCITINPLTAAGAAYPSVSGYTSNANESVDTPTIGGVGYCATATINSGTLTYGLRQ